MALSPAEAPVFSDFPLFFFWWVFCFDDEFFGLIITPGSQIAVEFSLMTSILCEHCENQWWV
jgi:hypothetical protein